MTANILYLQTVRYALFITPIVGMTVERCIENFRAKQREEPLEWGVRRMNDDGSFTWLAWSRDFNFSVADPMKLFYFPESGGNPKLIWEYTQ